ncbi:hypothetical protein FSP39_009066 [Pinctada imbricata]|uniref:Uncharacterized protein n=1 Tax=Pinctada imbricata TaxID=66713 RepID=A0AA88YCG9_PINIB|nr:hypothetical protein FSP39_009066 [Pinctada imbricata]
MATSMVKNMLGSYSDYFAALGAVAFSYLALKFACALLRGLKQFFLARTLGLSANIKKFGSWAVVTGSTDGIGKAYAEQLAKMGLKIVLISRSEDKLQNVAKEIGSKYSVETKIIAADYGRPDIYGKIQQQLNDLDIAILVNNVGMSFEYPSFFLELPDRDNMTSIVLPGMVERRKGAILNIASEAGCMPTPLLSVYSACKSYVVYLSEALNTEYKSKGIYVQTVCPCFVATKMSKIRKGNVFAPYPDTYVKSALGTVGVVSSTNGYWAHALQVWLTHLLPDCISKPMTFSVLNGARKRYIKKKARQQKTE